MDLIERQAAIKLAIDLDYESRGILKESKCKEIENRYNMIPSAQSDIVEKILAAGKEGKEVRIYIGGRLFAVRELAQ